MNNEAKEEEKGLLSIVVGLDFLAHITNGREQMRD